MRNLSKAVLACSIFGGVMLVAQSTSDIQFKSDPEPLKFPDNIALGEAAGVATNSHGDVFVYTRTGHPTITIGTARPFAHGGSRLVQFDKTGKFVREIGQDSYGFLVAQQVRVDPQDNVWIVDQMSSMVIKFDPNGRVQLLLGRKAEAETVPAPPLGSGRGGRGGGLPGALCRSLWPASSIGSGPVRARPALAVQDPAYPFRSPRPSVFGESPPGQAAAIATPHKVDTLG